MLTKLLVLITQAWTTLALLRFFLQKGGLAYLHPLAQLCMSMTDWAVKPARRYIRPVRGWDMAVVAVTFAAILLVQSVLVAVALFKGSDFSVILALYVVLGSLLFWSQALAYALIICLIIQMVLSFSDPYNPLMYTVSRVLSPLTAPFSKLRIGRFDFSGSVVFLVLWLWVGIGVPFLQSRLLFLHF